MLKQTILLASLGLFSFPACSGGSGDGSGGGGGGGGGNGSGIPASTQINDLSPTQVTSFCAWSINLQGGENIETDCGDGFSVDTGTVAECTESFDDFPQCNLTIGQVEPCLFAVADDPCEGFNSAACAALGACVSGGS